MEKAISIQQKQWKQLRIMQKQKRLNIETGIQELHQNHFVKVFQYTMNKLSAQEKCLMFTGDLNKHVMW